MPRSGEKVGILEAFGINDPAKALKDARKAVFGEKKVRPTLFGLSSIKIFKPAISIPAWLGIKRPDRLVPIYNFVNRDRPPVDTAYSVRVSKVRDFQGGFWTYDSHMGTDFAVPVGTHITTCAPGKVIRILNQLDHGGLKIFIDHGDGLITTYAHLSRPLVEEGDTVARGRSIALSGAAGIELIIFFPWVAPHLHLNVILNGNTVDPFAIEEKGEVPLWKNGNMPVPHSGPPDMDFEPTSWDETLIDDAIAECTDPEEREYLRSIPDIDRRVAETINYRLFYGTMFSSFPPLYRKEYERRPVLDLPLRMEDYNGVLFP